LAAAQQYVRTWRILLKKCSRAALPCDSLELWQQGDSGDDGRSGRDAGESFLRILPQRVRAVQSHASRDRSAQTGKPLPFAGEKFPTGAMASFRFRGAWKALEPHGAELISFVTPKTLAGIGTKKQLWP
jgi:hypothetical protein